MPAFLRLALDDNARTLNGVFLIARSYNVKSAQALGLPSAMPDAPLAYQGLRCLLVILPLARSPRVGLAGLYVVGNTSFF